MITLHYNGREFDAPASVDEMTPAQYEAMLRSVLMLQAAEFASIELRRALFAVLADIVVPLHFLRAELRQEIDAQLSALDGFFRMTPEGDVLAWQSVQNLMPTHQGFTGPGDLLEGVTFGEFVECLTIMEDVPQTPAGAYAVYERVARVLYHIPDDREVPSLLLIHAPALFGSVWAAIMEAPIEFNGKKIDFRIIFKNSGSGKPDDKTGWAGVTFEVAAAGLFGKVSEVEAAPFWEVLLYLYKCKFEYLNEMRKNGANN